MIFHVATLGALAAAGAVVFAEAGLPAWIALGAAILLAVSAYAARAESEAALQEAASSRHLTTRQRNALVSDLRPRPFKIEVDWARGAESQSYAAELRDALSEAGCEVTTNGGVADEGTYWGLLGPGPGFDERIEAHQLRAAFRAAGIELRRVLDRTETVRILVGSNPPKFGELPPENTISSEDPNRH